MSDTQLNKQIIVRTPPSGCLRAGKRGLKNLCKTRVTANSCFECARKTKEKKKSIKRYLRETNPRALHPNKDVRRLTDSEYEQYLFMLKGKKICMKKTLEFIFSERKRKKKDERSKRDGNGKGDQNTSECEVPS